MIDGGNDSQRIAAKIRHFLPDAGSGPEGATGVSAGKLRGRHEDCRSQRDAGG